MQQEVPDSKDTEDERAGGSPIAWLRVPLA